MRRTFRCAPPVGLVLPVLLVGLGLIPARAAKAGEPPGPFLDFSVGLAHMRTGWGPVLELHPGYAIGRSWMVFGTADYSFHLVDPYRSDAVGFLGVGGGYIYKSTFGIPVLFRAGISTFIADYYDRPDPPQGLGLFVGLDLKFTNGFAVGAEWSAPVDSSRDGMIVFPMTLTLQL